MKKEEQDLPVNFLSFIKKNWNWILLGVILIFGFYLRAYHIDYPVVGYHNWKETHYLTEARNFAEDGFFEHGFFIPEWDYPSLVDDPTGVHSDTFPTTSILTAIAFKIFGYKLWIARLINILFALGSVLLFYLIIKRLFEREDLALLSAAIMSINPLLVFFGRQVQLINPALF
ncbi:glycosyltransferase family 39 protein, partial [Candidatus Woesearchaeota archaeon]|nr:glycosyltransferase family 39 protein [Candidatus Woesearchaeota archaeon]